MTWGFEGCAFLTSSWWCWSVGLQTALWKNLDLLCLWFPLSTLLGKDCVVPFAPYPTHLTCSLILPIAQLMPHSPSGPQAARAASLLGISSPSPHCCVSSPNLEAQMQASSSPKAFLLPHPWQPQPPEPASPSSTFALHADSIAVVTGCQTMIYGWARLPTGQWAPPGRVRSCLSLYHNGM